MTSLKGKAPMGSRSMRLGAEATTRMLPLTQEQMTQYSNWAASAEESKLFREFSRATQSTAPASHSPSQFWHGRVPVAAHSITTRSSPPNPPTPLRITELRGIASPTCRRRHFELLISPHGKPIYGAFVVDPDVAAEPRRVHQLFEFWKTGAQAGEFVPIPTLGDHAPGKSFGLHYKTLKFCGSVDSIPLVLSFATRATTPIVSSCGSLSVHEPDARPQRDHHLRATRRVAGASSSEGATSRVRGRTQRQSKRAKVASLAGGREGRELVAGDAVPQRKGKEVVTVASSQRGEDLPERCHPCFPCAKCLEFWGEALPVRYFKNELKEFIRSPEEVRGRAVLPEEDCEEVKRKKRGSRKGPKSKSSSYRGVSFYWRTGRWESHIWHNGAQSFLGGSLTKILAAKAYDKAALVLYASEADINFKPSDYKEEFPFLSSLTKFQLEVYLRREAIGYGEEVKYPGVAPAKSRKRGYEAFYKPTKKQGTKEHLSYCPTEDEAVRIVHQEAKRRKNYEMAGRIMEVHHVRTVKPAHSGIRVKKPRGAARVRDQPVDLPATAPPAQLTHERAITRASNRTFAGALKPTQFMQETQRALLIRSANQTALGATETEAAPAAKRQRRLVNRNSRKSSNLSPFPKKTLQSAKPVPEEELKLAVHQDEEPARGAIPAAISLEVEQSQQLPSPARPAGHTSVPCRRIPSRPTTARLGLPLATIRSLQSTRSAGADYDIETMQALQTLLLISRSGSNCSFRPFANGGFPSPTNLSAPPHTASIDNDSSAQGSQVGAGVTPPVRPLARKRVSGPASEDLPPKSPSSVTVIRPVARRFQRTSTSGDQLWPALTVPSAGERSSGLLNPFSEGYGGSSEGSISGTPSFYHNDLLH